MTNVNRRIKETYQQDKYKIYLFDTGYILVLRKTDDGSTQKTEIIGKDSTSEDEGYVIVLRIANFHDQYDTPILDRIIELCENFIQNTKIEITSATVDIMLNYQDGYETFLQEVLSNNHYSDLKKWCVLVSIFSQAPALGNKDNKEFIYSYFNNHIDPEKIKVWDSFEQSALYLYPNFPKNGRVPEGNFEPFSKIERMFDNVDIALFSKNEKQFKAYLQVMNLLKDGDCSTLAEADSITHPNIYNQPLNTEEVKIIRYYLSNVDHLQNFPHITEEDLYDLQMNLAHLPSKIKAKLMNFVVKRVLETKPTGTINKNHEGDERQRLFEIAKQTIRLSDTPLSRVFPTNRDYDCFVRITDERLKDFPLSNVYLSKFSDTRVHDNAATWNFWIMMIKIFTEVGEEDFAIFFNDWIELIEDERDEYSFRTDSTTSKLTKSDTIEFYYKKTVEEGLPVRYLWCLLEESRSSKTA